MSDLIETTTSLQVSVRPGAAYGASVVPRKVYGLLTERRDSECFKQRDANDDATWNALLAALQRHDWVVYAKQPLGGPAQVLEYLSRYTH